MTDYDQMVERYGSLVLRIARSRMATATDAEDVFQEVFVTYACKQPVFADEPKARAWFAKTTVHHCRKLWRTIGRHMTESLEDVSELAGDSTAIAKDTSYVELRSALSQLPEKYLRPLELFYFADLSAEETARILRISPNAVRIRLTRGRAMLKDILG